MSLPISLHSNEYLEHLREFRDRALVESRWIGRRRSIGGFTFGTALARWQTDDGGTTSLADVGLRYKHTTLTKLMPTTLCTSYRRGEAGVEVVTFMMDIDVGHIEIYRNMITRGSFREILNTELHRRADGRHELSDPTDEQREFLYLEMQRGSTGLYTATYEDYEPEE